MPQDHLTTVIANREAAPGIFRLELAAPGLAEGLAPGQFIQVQIGSPGRGPFLRRPLGYFTRDRRTGRISLLTQVVGRGTGLLGALKPGEELSILGPLGHGFSSEATGAALLVAGGIGVVPLYDLAQTLAGMGTKVTFIYAARRADLLAAREELEKLPIRLVIATDDGSAGLRGTAQDALREVDLGASTRYYACGPRPMLAGLQNDLARTGMPGEFSLEERMACGFGVCLGCAAPMRGPDGHLVYRRVCYDGPVFPAAEVIFDA